MAVPHITSYSVHNSFTLTFIFIPLLFTAFTYNILTAYGDVFGRYEILLL